MRREPLPGNMGENLSLTNLSTKRQRIAELARTETRWASHLGDFLDRRVTDGVSYTTASETLP
jgi:hypothetical protein